MDELTLMRDAHRVEPPDDDLVRRERAALDTISSAPVPRVFSSHRPRRRRLTLAAIGAATVLAGSAAAAATGILPVGVQERFGLTADNEVGMRADVDEARLQSTYVTPDGVSYELWLAPTDGDGECFTVIREGAKDDPFAACTNSPVGAVHPIFIVYQIMSVGDRMAIYGTAPGDTITVTLTFDGEPAIAQVDDHEFFTVIDQPDCENTICEVTAAGYDSNGQLVATGL